MVAVTICSDFGAPSKIKSVTVCTVSPSICYEVMGPDAMILVFWILSFKPTSSFSSFTFIKRLFSSSSLSAIRVVSSAYLKLLIFLLAILIPACAYSSPAFLMMYSTYKLNKQGDNIQPWRTPFPIWNQSVVPCPVLTVASWPAYMFLKRQVRWSFILLISFNILLEEQKLQVYFWRFGVIWGYFIWICFSLPPKKDQIFYLGELQILVLMQIKSWNFSCS